jgi:hypothetical protein
MENNVILGVSVDWAALVTALVALVASITGYNRK